MLSYMSLNILEDSVTLMRNEITLPRMLLQPLLCAHSQLQNLASKVYYSIFETAAQA